MRGKLLLIIYAMVVTANDLRDPIGSSGEDIEDSAEHIGAAITQVYQHPYAASLLMNGSYICSAVVLNNYWVLSISKCFYKIQSEIISAYVTQNLQNFSIRAGSSYNNKGGTLYKIKMLTNNFDLHVTAAKLADSMEFSSKIQAVRLPNPEEDVALGFLASIIAWTPSNHMRMVNAPVIEPSICERNAKMLPGHYICLGGVQDPNRHFCRRDNGGAVIQNNTLIGISTFINTCAIYSKTHAFPKVASFTHWLNTVIWDENNRPTTIELSTSASSIQLQTNTTEASTYIPDHKIYMLTLPFEPINVPLEPAEDNSVLPAMSLYESYLKSMSKPKFSTNISEPTVTIKESTIPTKTNKLISSYKKIPIKYGYDYN